MRKMVKRVLTVVVLCLFVGVQHMNIVQAAVNYEACPFCGTRVDRYTTEKKVFMLYKEECTEHDRCDIYDVLYSAFSVVRCQTAGCLHSENRLYDTRCSTEHVPK